ncbi:MAG: hypothetical protein KDN22_16635 [Verrucomicrobiae bacterium]|nr:hypothetical protein [Verrucomicrobiae bacterium]
MGSRYRLQAAGGLVYSARRFGKSTEALGWIGEQKTAGEFNSDEWNELCIGFSRDLEPDVAFQILRSDIDEDIRANVLRYFKVEGSTLKESLDYVKNSLNLKSPAESELAYGNAYRKWIAEDPMQVIQYSYGDGNYNSDDEFAPIEYALKELVDRNPREAVNWFEMAVTNPDHKEAIAKGIVREWLRVDSIDASTWVSEIKDPIVKSDAVTTLVDFLVHKGDLEAAAIWEKEVSDSGKLP